MAMDNLIELITPLIKENPKIIKYMVMVFILGQMEEFIREIGFRTKCVGRVNLLGLMVEAIKVVIKMIKKK